MISWPYIITILGVNCINPLSFRSKKHGSFSDILTQNRAHLIPLCQDLMDQQKQMGIPRTSCCFSLFKPILWPFLVQFISRQSPDPPKSAAKSTFQRRELAGALAPWEQDLMTSKTKAKHWIIWALGWNSHDQRLGLGFCSSEMVDFMIFFSCPFLRGKYNYEWSFTKSSIENIGDRTIENTHSQIAIFRGILLRGLQLHL